MNEETLTKWLHNPMESDHTFYYRRRDGIAVEHMLRPASYSMRCNHFHTEYEIYFLMHGKRQIFFDNCPYLLEEGNLALIDSSRIHMTSPVPDNTDKYYERIILYLNKEKVEEYDRMFPELQMRSFFQQHDGIYNLTPAERQKVMQMFETVMRELDGEQSRRRTLTDLTIIRYFIGFCRMQRPMAYQMDTTARQSKGKFSIAHNVSEYISAHYCEEIPLEKLAEEFSVSESYLSRSFKDVVGVGIREYVNILRIRQAQQMLEESKLSVSEIAEAVGFESASYFGQVFQKHLAISPSQYRKEVSHSSTATPLSHELTE